MARKPEVDKFNILRTACLNVTSLTTVKREAIRGWILDSKIDVLGVAETGITDGKEPLDWANGYRFFYNSFNPKSISSRGIHNNQGDTVRTSDIINTNWIHKWGVAVAIREHIKVCDVVRPGGVLLGRVLMIATCLVSNSPSILWIVCVYAPVKLDEHDQFFQELNSLWMTKFKEGNQALVVGDFNARIPFT